MPQPCILSIHKTHTDTITETLLAAFRHDPFMLWLLGGEQAYDKVGYDLIKTWVRYVRLYGAGYMLEGGVAAVLFKKPGDTGMHFWRLIRSGMIKTQSLLGKAGMQRLMAMNQLWGEKRLALMGNRDYLYCWMLGTAPQAQGNGYGRALMQHGLKQYPDVPCYLETQNEQNCAFYEHIGFTQRARFKMPGADFPVVAMCREPEV